MQRRILLVTVLAFMFFVASGDVCDDLYDIDFKLTNSGRDPIHINGKRIAIGETKSFANLDLDDTRTYDITRDDINLGSLSLHVIDPDREGNNELSKSYDCDITMTEPVYFQLRFSARCEWATVTCTGPWPGYETQPPGRKAGRSAQMN